MLISSNSMIALPCNAGEWALISQSGIIHEHDQNSGLTHDAALAGVQRS